jgi:ADP-ribose pyrophosphatase
VTADELRVLRRDVLYTGKVFDLVVDRVALPSGREGVREVARHPGGSVIIPLFADGTVLLVEQLRYPLGKRLLELPAGKRAAGEEPASAARRELEEETGYRAGRIEKLLAIYTTPGFCDEELHLFRALDLTAVPGGPRREEGEHSMTLHRMPLDQARALIEQGAIADAKTIIGLLLARIGTQSE